MLIMSEEATMRSRVSFERKCKLIVKGLNRLIEEAIKDGQFQFTMPREYQDDSVLAYVKLMGYNIAISEEKQKMFVYWGCK